MKSRTATLLGLLLAANLGLTVFLLATRDQGNVGAAAEAKSVAPPSKSGDLSHLEESLAALRDDLADLRGIVDGTPAQEEGAAEGEADEATNLIARLVAMEKSIGRLENAMDGISLEAASAERDKLFAGEDGHLEADEYFEAGKFAIAGEGYLKFLEAHPDHPDHRGILERARNAFNRAGYADKAIWVQEEMIRIHPENRGRDLMQLARMERNSGRMGDAIRHAEESAAAHNDSDRYWSLLYAAWYTQLANGEQAGLDYYRNVQQQIIQAGHGDGRLGDRAAEEIEEIERRIAGGN